mgnify:CR=1 FL=1
MIAKIHKHGAKLKTQRGAHPVNYLLGKNRDREHARVLRGDPDQIIKIIDSSDFKNKYTSGVLRFTEQNLDQALKEQIMDEAEQAYLPGLSAGQYEVLWVEHLDKGSLELNFVFANVELTTGKRLQPYYHGSDFKRIEAWNDRVNLTHNFGNPKDPSRERAIHLSDNLPRSIATWKTKISDWIMAKVESGAITDRSSLVKSINELGNGILVVVRETKNSISIKHADHKVNMRFKGLVFQQDFTPTKLHVKPRISASEKWKSQRQSQLKEASELYNFCWEKRAKENIKKYSQEKPEVIRTINVYEMYEQYDEINKTKLRELARVPDKPIKELTSYQQVRVISAVRSMLLGIEYIPPKPNDPKFMSVEERKKLFAKAGIEPMRPGSLSANYRTELFTKVGIKPKRRSKAELKAAIASVMRKPKQETGNKNGISGRTKANHHVGSRVNGEIRCPRGGLGSTIRRRFSAINAALSAAKLAVVDYCTRTPRSAGAAIVRRAESNSLALYNASWLHYRGRENTQRFIRQRLQQQNPNSEAVAAKPEATNRALYTMQTQ